MTKQLIQKWQEHRELHLRMNTPKICSSYHVSKLGNTWLMVEKILWTHDDKRLGIWAIHLASQDMEKVGWSSNVDDTQIVVFFSIATHPLCHEHIPVLPLDLVCLSYIKLLHQNLSTFCIYSLHWFYHCFQVCPSQVAFSICITTAAFICKFYISKQVCRMHTD
jgi:hypothetical protein